MDEQKPTTRRIIKTKSKEAPELLAPRRHLAESVDEPPAPRPPTPLPEAVAPELYPPEEEVVVRGTDRHGRPITGRVANPGTGRIGTPRPGTPRPASDVHRKLADDALNRAGLGRTFGGLSPQRIGIGVAVSLVLGVVGTVLYLLLRP